MADTPGPMETKVHVRLPTAAVAEIDRMGAREDRTRAAMTRVLVVEALKRRTSGGITPQSLGALPNPDPAPRPFIEAVKRTDATISGTSDIPYRRSGPHDFQPQTKNARCGECGRLRHEH